MRISSPWKIWRRARYIPSFLAESDEQAAMAAFLSLLAPDVVYYLGWSYLLRSVPKGMVGYHPAEAFMILKDCR